MRHESYRESRSRYQVINNAAMTEAMYCAITSPNYAIERDKLIRAGYSANGVSNAIELLKRQDRARRAARYAKRKGKA